MPTNTDVGFTIKANDQASKILAAIDRQLGSIQKEVQQTARSFDSISRTTSKLGQEVADTSRRVNKFNNSLRQTKTQLDRTQQASKRTAESMGDLGQALGVISSALARVSTFGIRQLTDFIQQGANLERITSAYGRLLGSTEKATEALDTFRKLADEPGLTFETITKAAQGFIAFGLSVEDTTQHIANFGNAGANASISQDELLLGLRQLRQAMARGKFEADEIYSTLERFPSLTGIFRPFGNDAQRVNAHLKETNQTINEFLLEHAALSNQVKADGGTLSNQFSNLENEITKAKQALGSALIPEIKTFTEELTKLVKQFNELDEEQQRNIALWIAATTAVTALGTAVTAVAAAIAVAKFAFAGWGTAIAGAVKGLGALIAANPAVVAGLGIIGITTYDIVKATKELNDATKAYNRTLYTGASSAIPGYAAELGGLRRQLQEINGITRTVQRNVPGSGLLNLRQARDQIQSFRPPIDPFAKATEGAQKLAGAQNKLSKEAIKANQERVKGLQEVERRNVAVSKVLTEAVEEYNQMEIKANQERVKGLEESKRKAVELGKTLTEAAEEYSQNEIEANQKRVQALEEQTRRELDAIEAINKGKEDARQEEIRRNQEVVRTKIAAEKRELEFTNFLIQGDEERDRKLLESRDRQLASIRRAREATEKAEVAKQGAIDNTIAIVQQLGNTFAYVANLSIITSKEWANALNDVATAAAGLSEAISGITTSVEGFSSGDWVSGLLGAIQGLTGVVGLISGIIGLFSGDEENQNTGGRPNYNQVAQTHRAINAQARQVGLNSIQPRRIVSRSSASELERARLRSDPDRDQPITIINQIVLDDQVIQEQVKQTSRLQEAGRANNNNNRNRPGGPNL